ncbi:hypothetical protein SSABA_v1c05960 [Spiroplasma sabaudiense Ar-1343]|uniref:Uncharacterized protein n=1 Tax=Spiroplasma sabaudiense Ar-1343 TaxID=1276257 RepID=W6AAW9_9MOLU|nr:hypothetical protein [Spiroplasma sabaudiense]AHI54000.1 hypothetical protein SSABA_v1c05960 [Spiroplasma sabaudiense Ar-1343]
MSSSNINNEYFANLKFLQDENLHLRQEIEVLQAKHKYLDEGIAKTKEVFDVANHNAEKIIMRALDFSYNVKQAITKLLLDLRKHKKDEQVFLQIIENFLDKNEKIFSFDKNEISTVAKIIKSELLETS